MQVGDLKQGAKDNRQDFVQQSNELKLLDPIGSGDSESRRLQVASWLGVQ